MQFEIAYWSLAPGRLCGAALMAITLTKPAVALNIPGARRCYHCKHWGAVPSFTAPPTWERCRVWNIDRSPGATCSHWVERVRPDAAGGDG